MEFPLSAMFLHECKQAYTGIQDIFYYFRFCYGCLVSQQLHPCDDLSMIINTSLTNKQFPTYRNSFTKLFLTPGKDTVCHGLGVILPSLVLPLRPSKPCCHLLAPQLPNPPSPCGKPEMTLGGTKGKEHRLR